MSGYFSMAETGMMAINRYRLRHLVRQNNKKAIRVTKLLEHPERLLGFILVGNSVATIIASTIATVLAERTWGEGGIAATTFILALIILIFSEICPKTFAASYAQKVSFSFSFTLTWLLKIFYPVIWILNMISQSIFKISGIKIEKNIIEHLSQEELRTVVHEAGSRLLIEHQDIILKTLDLQKITVNDIMIPNHEIQGIDLEDDWDIILEQISHSYHARLPIYRNTVENIEGILHIRKIIFLLREGKLNKELLINLIEKPNFLPEETPLLTQLINFRQQKCRIGFVVNEYGEVQGLITLEDILKEIVGEFTINLFDIASKNILPQPDGSFIVDGSTNIREINKVIKLNLPTTGPKTISGLIITQLEMIPASGTCLLILDHPIEVIQVKDNMIKTARIFKQISKKIPT